MSVLQWHNEFKLGDVLTFLGLMLATVTLFFTGRQVRAAGRQLRLARQELNDAARSQRAQFLLDATARYFSDIDVRKLFYDINYDEIKITFDDEHNPWI